MNIFAATDWNPLIVALSVSVPTILGMIAAWIDIRRKAAETKKDLTEVKKNVEKIELATNSMKDALVKATRDEALLRGASTERIRADVEKSQRALGILDEKTRADSSDDVIVKEGKVIVDNPAETPIVVDIKQKPGLIADDKKGTE